MLFTTKLISTRKYQPQLITQNITLLQTCMMPRSVDHCLGSISEVNKVGHCLG